MTRFGEILFIYHDLKKYQVIIQGLFSNLTLQCYKAFIIEDIELWDEQKALHCFNLISEYRKYLLITTKNSVNNFALQDLSSRINSVIKLEIKRPDDELMRILIFKHFSDHAVIVSDNVIEYLLIILTKTDYSI